MSNTSQSNFRRFEISDVLNDCNDYKKVGDFYRDIRSHLSNPIFTTPRNLVAINRQSRRRDLNYSLELFNGDIDIITIELFGSWKGYAPESDISPHPLENQDNSWLGMNIALSEEEQRIIKEILKLTRKYPSGEKGKY